MFERTTHLSYLYIEETFWQLYNLFIVYDACEYIIRHEFGSIIHTHSVCDFIFPLNTWNNKVQCTCASDWLTDQSTVYFCQQFEAQISSYKYYIDNVWFFVLCSTFVTHNLRWYFVHLLFEPYWRLELSWRKLFDDICDFGLIRQNWFSAALLLCYQCVYVYHQAQIVYQ